jgi:hypothetical protein
VSGVVAARPSDGLPEGLASILLLSPDEPGFWAHVTAAPEFAAGAHPLDRWSARVIGRLAAAVGGMALFPFGGPPWRPFVQWALRSGRAHASPVSLMVHDRMGLFASWRGAVAVAEAIAEEPAESPCETCLGRPCLTACPPRALTAAGYDLPACHGFLDTGPGADCMERGCAVRRACPVSRAYGRLEAQSAHHMRSFHR